MQITKSILKDKALVARLSIQNILKTIGLNFHWTSIDALCQNENILSPIYGK